MYQMMKLVILGALLCVVGCGGGNGTGTMDPPAEALVDRSSISEQPPQPPLFDCESIAPVPTDKEINASLEGVWEGTLVDCTSQTTSGAWAYVTKTGRLHLVADDDVSQYEHGGLLTGVIREEGETFAGEGRYFSPSGGWSAELTVSGLIRAGNPIIVSADWVLDRARMEGLWAADSGNYGYFALDYGAGQNDPLTETGFGWPAQWDLWRASSFRALDGASWTIERDGAVVGTGIAGGDCAYSGQFATAEPQFVFDLDLDITGCELEGRYSGVGYPHSGPFNDILEVAVDDGNQQSIVMHFGSK